MTTTKKPHSDNRVITEQDLAAAARLKKIWDDFREDLKNKRDNMGITRKEALAIPDKEEKRKLVLDQRLFGEEIGAHQTLVSRYLNGYNALNRGVVLLFAKRLNVQPADIYPELFADLNVQLVTDDQFFEVWKQLTEDQKQGLKIKALALVKKNTE